jgi:hypothetical protein
MKHHSFHPGPIVSVDAIAHLGSFHAAFDEAQLLQLFEVLGNGRLSQANFSHQVSTDAGVQCKQMLQNGYPGWVSEDFGEQGDLILPVSEHLGFG